MKTYSESYFFLHRSESCQSLQPPPQLFLILSGYHPPTLLSSQSCSPQEGEADGGSGKIRWGEDEEEELEDRGAGEEKGSQMLGWGMGVMEEKWERESGRRERRWSNDEGKMMAGELEAGAAGRGEGMAVQERSFLLYGAMRKARRAPAWYVSLWESFAYMLSVSNMTHKFKGDMAAVQSTHNIVKTWLDQLMHVHMTVSLLMHSLACIRHALPYT